VGAPEMGLEEELEHDVALRATGESACASALFRLQEVGSRRFALGFDALGGAFLFERPTRLLAHCLPRRFISHLCPLHMGPGWSQFPDGTPLRGPEKHCGPAGNDLPAHMLKTVLDECHSGCLRTLGPLADVELNPLVLLE
jgi:hypothetical protein